MPPNDISGRVRSTSVAWISFSVAWAVTSSVIRRNTASALSGWPLRTYQRGLSGTSSSRPRKIAEGSTSDASIQRQPSAMFHSVSPCAAMAQLTK
ncbi:hypothetical protein D3C83_109730 [compost metagenome]